MNIPGKMRSIAALQSTCNTLEKGLTAKLQSLHAAEDTDGAKVTEAIFEEFDGLRGELGKAKIEEKTSGTHSTFIDGNIKKVALSRN